MLNNQLCLRAGANDSEELANTILHCIRDGRTYMVKNLKIKQLIFSKFKESITKNSLVLTPNLLRYMSFYLLSSDRTSFLDEFFDVVLKTGNLQLFVDSKKRLLIRVLGTAMIALSGGLLNIANFVIPLSAIYFQLSESCHFRCQDYFTTLKASEEKSLNVYALQEFGNVLVTNQESKNINLYIPSTTEEEQWVKDIPNSNDKIIGRRYKMGKKAKSINFRDFVNSNPSLKLHSAELLGEEPIIDPLTCPINEFPNNIQNENWAD